eukprot:TRINITY_DN3934_c0_g1_i6.p1 TRINITY_DN3934_c0_g1~~TRINITY_DN3934_c0_g1_i6.p1  ORF type:complete len:721 (+),score=201.56 TRINITY_DN3934_c0_g1_i6:67-2229(+)
MRLLCLLCVAAVIAVLPFSEALLENRPDLLVPPVALDTAFVDSTYGTYPGRVARSVDLQEVSSRPNLMVFTPAIPVSHDSWTLIAAVNQDATHDIHLRVHLANGQSKDITLNTKKYARFGHIALGRFPQTQGEISTQRVEVWSASGVQDLQTAGLEGLIWELQALPDSFDYSKSGSSCLYPVQDQGSCGNCFAWSSGHVGSVRQCSGRVSVRQITCFMGAPGHAPCDGGYTDVPLNYMRTNGLATESCYSISASCSNPVPATCPVLKLTKPDGRSNVWSYVTLPDSIPDSKLNVIKTMLLNYGPVPYNFELHESFMFHGSNSYGSWFSNACKGQAYRHGQGGCCFEQKKHDCFLGLFCRDKSSDCLPKVGGHAMVLVGWRMEGTTTVWRIQNSWGTGWFDHGFIDIYATNNGIPWVAINLEGNEYNTAVVRSGLFGLSALEQGLEHPSVDLWPLDLAGVNNDTNAFLGPVPADTLTRFMLASWAEEQGRCSVTTNATLQAPERSLQCWYNLTLTLTQQVYMSEGIRRVILNLNGADKLKANPYPAADVASKLATQLFNSTIYIDEITPEVNEATILSIFMAPYGFTSRGIQKKTTQVVNGKIWRMHAMIGQTNNASAPDVPIFVSIRTDGVDSDRIFRISLQSEDAFNFNAKSDAQGTNTDNWNKSDDSILFGLNLGQVIGICAGIVGLLALVSVFIIRKYKQRAELKAPMLENTPNSSL